MTHSHPAIKAHLTSINCAQSGEKENWLALFAEDAILHDPVGPSPHDPTGEGFRGKARLEAFWDTMIGPSDTQIVSHQQISSGSNDCACIATATNTLSEDLCITIEMVVSYRVNDAGLITSLRAFWDQEAIAKQLGL